VEDGEGGGQAAGDVFERMALGSGYSNLAIVDSPGSESSVLLEFVEPMVVYPGQEEVLSLRVDIDSTAAADAFALSLKDPGSSGFRDCNTENPVPVISESGFPLRTASCEINDPSRFLAVSPVPVLAEHLNHGQRDVPLLQVVLRHCGALGSSQIKFTELSFELSGPGGSSISPGEVAEKLLLLEQQTTVGELQALDSIDSTVTVRLASPLVLSPGREDTVTIGADLRSEPQVTGFSLTIRDSSMFLFRDLSSGSRIPAVGDTAAEIGQPVFPIRSGFTALRRPAPGPGICLESRLPPSVVAGDDSVALIRMDLDYRETGDYSPVLVTGLEVSLLDTVGRPLDPHRLFDRIGFTVPGEAVEYSSTIELHEGHTVFELGDQGLELLPGGELTVDLIADVESDAPYEHFLMRVHQAGMVRVHDITDPRHIPGLEPGSGCGDLFPFETGRVSLYLPAGIPALTPVPVGTRLGAPGSKGLELFAGDLTYQTAVPQGDLVLVALSGEVLKVTASGGSPFSAEDVFDAVHLLAGGQVIATDSVLSDAGISLVPDGEYCIPRGTEHRLAVLCDLDISVPPGNYVLEFEGDDFIELADRNLDTTVYPEVTGTVFPLRGAELSVALGDLESSFTNYPNPFNPGRGEETTIGFHLGESARVDIEVFTVTGKLVKRVVSDSERAPGIHDDDTWSGLNARGLEVLPGTYLCRITVIYASGEVQSCRRKVMVIR
jgi:hypothetical protein